MTAAHSIYREGQSLSLSVKLGPISGQIHLKEEVKKKKRVDLLAYAYVPLSPPSPALTSFKFPLGCCWLASWLAAVVVLVLHIFTL